MEAGRCTRPRSGASASLCTEREDLVGLVEAALEHDRGPHIWRGYLRIYLRMNMVAVAARSTASTRSPSPTGAGVARIAVGSSGSAPSRRIRLESQTDHGNNGD
jgi:hypothetical protein